MFFDDTLIDTAKTTAEQRLHELVLRGILLTVKLFDCDLYSIKFE